MGGKSGNAGGEMDEILWNVCFGCYVYCCCTRIFFQPIYRKLVINLLVLFFMLLISRPIIITQILSTFQKIKTILMNKYPVIQYKEGQLLGSCLYLRDTPAPETNNTKRRFGRFVCSCGNVFDAQIDKVKHRGDECNDCRYNKASASMTLHGGGRSNRKNKKATKEYATWARIKDRCYNPKNEYFHHYGGRGIIMCERWFNSYECFLEDMGRAPSVNHSIDRFPDVNGIYEKTNCRWGTDKEQTRNRRNNIIVEFKGERIALIDLAERFNVKYKMVYSRVVKFKWGVEKALFTPSRFAIKVD